MTRFNVNGGIVRRNGWIFEFPKFFRILITYPVLFLIAEKKTVCLTKKCNWNNLETDSITFRETTFYNTLVESVNWWEKQNLMILQKIKLTSVKISVLFLLFKGNSYPGKWLTTFISLPSQQQNKVVFRWLLICI